MIKHLKLLPVIFLLLIAFVVKALPSESFSIQEERLYDKFGLADHIQKGDIELKASDSIKMIEINYTAKVAKACKMRLRANIPHVFNPEVKIIKTNVPIDSNFIFHIDNVDRELKLEVKIKLNLKIDKEEVADEYPPNIDELLQVDGLFDPFMDDPEIQKIANSIDKGQGILKLIEDIKNYAKDVLEYYENETNFNIIESLRAGVGDCDDYARLFVAISRSLGIPSRVAFNSRHMWVEVLLPLKDGSYRWMVVDPLDSSEISYPLSLDIEPECENYVIEDETWTFELFF